MKPGAVASSFTPSARTRQPPQASAPAAAPPARPVSRKQQLNEHIAAIPPAFSDEVTPADRQRAVHSPVRATVTAQAAVRPILAADASAPATPNAAFKLAARLLVGAVQALGNALGARGKMSCGNPNDQSVIEDRVARSLQALLDLVISIVKAKKGLPAPDAQAVNAVIDQTAQQQAAHPSPQIRNSTLIASRLDALRAQTSIAAAVGTAAGPTPAAPGSTPPAAVASSAGPVAGLPPAATQSAA